MPKLPLPFEEPDGKVICIDFDGVLHDYTSWNNGKLNGPVPYAPEASRGWVCARFAVRRRTVRCAGRRHQAAARTTRSIDGPATGGSPPLPCWGKWNRCGQWPGTTRQVHPVAGSPGAGCLQKVSCSIPASGRNDPSPDAIRCKRDAGIRRPA